MRLSSCRDLKRTLLDRAYALPSPTCDHRRYRLPRARRGGPRSVDAHEATPLAAVGVAPAAPVRTGSTTGAGAPARRGRRGRDPARARPGRRGPSARDGYRVALRVFAGHERQLPRLLAGLERHAAELDVATGVLFAPRLTLRAGGSIGHYRTTAGTLGAFVEDDDEYYMLSNAHVFANSNCAFGGDAILQPGPADIRGRHHVVGELDRWPALTKARSDGVDAALATFTDTVDDFEPWAYRGIGTISTEPAADRFAVTRVTKRGRTTGVTRGTVSAFELDGVAIDYGTADDPAVVVFDDQVEIVGDPPRRPFSAGGDSGSLVIDRDGMRGYALLYGGGPDDAGIDRSVAHFLPDVLAELDVRLVR